MKAIVIQSAGKAELVNDRPIPKIREGYMLVKTVAVALNPTDWKHIDFLATLNALVGCDYSGTVEEVGTGVTKRWQKGDRCCGMAHGGDAVQIENGAFAEYIVVKADIQMKVPDDLSFEEAATLGVGISTVGQALYQSLQLPSPSHPTQTPFPLLVYGGSTATGSLAIQFARLSGLTVLATASPHNFPLCRSLGAAATFDYNDPSCAAHIRAFAGDGLHYAFDTISTERTAALCVAAMAPASAPQNRYTNLLPLESLPRADVFHGYTLAYTSFGEDFMMGPKRFEAKPEDLAFARGFWEVAEGALAGGKVKVHPVEVRKGGLGGVLEGLEDLKEGKVSGVKLVYRVGDTA